MADTPVYSLGDIVYLKESAALGFIEPMRVSGIQLGQTGWLYAISVGPANPVSPAHYGDRIQQVTPARLYFTEDELLLLCDALELAEVNAQLALDKIRTQRANLCSGTE